MTTERVPPDAPSIHAVVESLLFAASSPVTARQLAEAIECDLTDIETAVQELTHDYQNRGLRLQRQGDRLQLVTSPDAAPFIERFLGLSVTTSLSAAALETLAVIAYKQPITRPEIEAVRGVNSDGVLRTLVSKGLVEEVGRLETVGHPVLFGTTFDFLQYFGLSSLGDLPPLETPQTEPV